jgi:hypothetical protein
MPNYDDYADGAQQSVDEYFSYKYKNLEAFEKSLDINYNDNIEEQINYIMNQITLVIENQSTSETGINYVDADGKKENLSTQYSIFFLVTIFKKLIAKYLEKNVDNPEKIIKIIIDCNMFLCNTYSQLDDDLRRIGKHSNVKFYVNSEEYLEDLNSNLNDDSCIVWKEITKFIFKKNFSGETIVCKKIQNTCELDEFELIKRIIESNYVFFKNCDFYLFLQNEILPMVKDGNWRKVSRCLDLPEYIDSKIRNLRSDIKYGDNNFKGSVSKSWKSYKIKNGWSLGGKKSKKGKKVRKTRKNKKNRKSRK